MLDLPQVYFVICNNWGKSNNVQKMLKGNLRPEISKSTCDRAFQLNQEIWLREDANGKDENFMAIQRRQRIYSDLIQPNRVLPLMAAHAIFSCEQFTE